MSRFWKQGIAVLALTAAVDAWCFSPALAKPPSGGGTSYTIVKLDDANGAWECFARDINNLRDVVGKVEVRDPPERRAAYWAVSGAGGSV